MMSTLLLLTLLEMKPRTYLHDPKLEIIEPLDGDQTSLHR